MSYNDEFHKSTLTLDRIRSAGSDLRWKLNRDNARAALVVLFGAYGCERVFEYLDCIDINVKRERADHTETGQKYIAALQTIEDMKCEAANAAESSRATLRRVLAEKPTMKKPNFFLRLSGENEGNFWSRFRKTLLFGECFTIVYGDIGEVTGCLVYKYNNMPDDLRPRVVEQES